MTCLRTLGLLALLAHGPFASAADQNGLFAIRGAGLLTCLTYVQEREAASDAYLMIGGWLDGYVTAVNELSLETFDVTPYVSTELLTVLINRHCKGNPTDILFAVTNTLLAKLFDEHLKSSSVYVDVRVSLEQMRLYTGHYRANPDIPGGKGVARHRSDGAMEPCHAECFGEIPGIPRHERQRLSGSGNLMEPVAIWLGPAWLFRR
jgi:hypothetical protein